MAEEPIQGVTCSGCGGANLWLDRERQVISCDDCDHQAKVGRQQAPKRAKR